MMRITELLENITPYGSMSPAEYSVFARQRDAALKQKRQATQQARRKQEKLRQKQVWARSKAAKPIKLKTPTRRRRRNKLKVR